MDPAIKQGFALGLVIAVALGYFGWREGWWPTPGVKSAIESQIAPDTAAPKGDQKPSAKATPEQPATPQAQPDRQAAEPASPEPPANPPASPPAAPQASAPPKQPDAPPAASASPETAKPAPQKAENGAFDVVRVEPTGEAVVAGRCPSRCVVELTVNGRTLDKATADDGGAWAMTPPQLPPGDHQLGLKVTTPDGKSATSEQSVTVSVPQSPKGEVAVVLNEPNAPSKILQRPGGEPAPSVAQAPVAPSSAQAKASDAKSLAQKAGEDKAAGGVSIGAVDAEKGRLFVQGTASAGATLRVYLNNALVAQPVAGREERWSVRIERGLTRGDYVARVDQVETTSGKVLARAEAKFAYEGELAEASPKATRPQAETQAGTASSGGSPAAAAEPATPAPGATAEPSQSAPPASAEAAKPDAAPDSANPVVASIDTTNVRRGDSLWRISRKTYGAGARYTVIFLANDSQIRDPNLIYPGQVLVLPEDAAKTSGRP